MRVLSLLAWIGEVIALRGSPADAPAGRTPLMQFAALDLLSSMAYLEAVGRDYSPVTIAVLLVIRLAVVYGVIALFGRPARFQQTAITMMGVSAVLTFLMLPLATALTRADPAAADLDLQLLRFGFLGMLFWSIVVEAHIWRHAVNLSFWFALPLAIGLFILLNLVASELIASE